MGGAAPPPTDWKGMQAQVTSAADKTLANNRLNTSNPFSSQTFNPDGSTSQQFNGGLGTANAGLMGQAGALGQGMDWSQFGPVGTGDGARDQAINASYGQATSRLDPQWQKREEAQRTQLLNQGLDPSSEAYKNQMSDLGNQRNDAYTSAMNMAIGQGTAAGDSAFRNNMLGHQQSIADAIRQRQMPLEEMQKLGGLMGQQPGYNQDGSTMQGAMASTGIQQAADKQAWDQKQAADAAAAGTAGGVMSGIGTAAGIAAMFF